MDGKNLTTATRFRLSVPMLFFAIALFLPLSDLVLSQQLKIADLLRPIFVYAVFGLGQNIVTGYTGLLNLGVAGFMAIGAYTYGILTCEIYPFQFGFWISILCSIISGAISGVLLGLPTIRLRGDYLAIVTLGFGEIIQDCLRNLDTITKGTQGINPLPSPSIFYYSFTPDIYQPWYYLFLAILLLVVCFSYRLERSRVGRAWISIREDELASGCMGIPPVKNKLLAFSVGASLCSLAGALWVTHLGSTGEPGNYDFQVSIVALCIIVVGGMGSISGVLVGALLMVGFNSIFLARVSDFMMRKGWIDTSSVFLSPNNWKYMIYGLALIITMRYMPQGLVPAGGSSRGKQKGAEVH